MPRKTIDMKKTATHKFAHGNIAKAFGKILKLSPKPDKGNESMLMPIYFVK